MHLLCTHHQALLCRIGEHIMYNLRCTGQSEFAVQEWGLQRQVRTLTKLIKEMRPKADAPTKDAVAAVAIAETENKVPMFIMQVVSISEFVIFWLACTKTVRPELKISCLAMQLSVLSVVLQEAQHQTAGKDTAHHTSLLRSADASTPGTERTSQHIFPSPSCEVSAVPQKVKLPDACNV